MNESRSTPAMSQKIFKMGFSVTAVSAYLLCCNLADTDTPISTKNLANVWNGARKELIGALKQLEKSGIIQCILTDHQENTVYKLIDAQDWNGSVP